MCVYSFSYILVVICVHDIIYTCLHALQLEAKIRVHTLLLPVQDVHGDMSAGEVDIY